MTRPSWGDLEGYVQSTDHLVVMQYGRCGVHGGACDVQAGVVGLDVEILGELVVIDPASQAVAETHGALQTVVDAR